MEDEYVIYRTAMVPSKVKGEFPDVVYIYLADSLHNPSYTKDIKEAYRIFEADEALETADLLGMQAGVLELKVRQFRKCK